MSSFVKQPSIQELDSLAYLFNEYLIFYEVGSNIEGATEFVKTRLENKDSRFYVVESDGKFVGFMQLYPLFDSLAMKPLVMLNDLYVLPEHRRCGYAQKLIITAQKYAKEIGAAGVILDTAKTNIEGNNLYPKMDFYQIKDFNFYRYDVK